MSGKGAAEALIKRVVLFKLDIEFLEKLTTPIGTIDGARNVIVMLECEGGFVGYGEAAPFAPITGDSQDSNHKTAQLLGRLVKGQSALALEAHSKEFRASNRGETSIRSAFDMALFDIAAQRAELPLYQYLGGSRREIRTDQTIGIQGSVDRTMKFAQEILDQGYNAIKLKVGRPNLGDVEHVAAVRELAGPDVAIRIDTNQGWDYSSAISNIEAMAPLNLQYSEQPLPYWDVEGLSRLRQQVNLPICADESVFDEYDALNLIRREAADILNIKLGKSGGISTSLKINTIAAAAGRKCMIGCFSESRLGLTAAAHLAMSRENIEFLDLDSATYFAEDPVDGGISYDEKIGGLIHVNDTPGIGAVISPNSRQASDIVEI